MFTGNLEHSELLDESVGIDGSTNIVLDNSVLDTSGHLDASQEVPFKFVWVIQTIFLTQGIIGMGYISLIKVNIGLGYSNLRYFTKKYRVQEISKGLV